MTLHDHESDRALWMLQISLEILRTLCAVRLGFEVRDRNRLTSQFELQNMILPELESNYAAEERFAWMTSLSLAYLSMGNTTLSSFLWSAATLSATDAQMV